MDIKRMVRHSDGASALVEVGSQAEDEMRAVGFVDEDGPQPEPAAADTAPRRVRRMPKADKPEPEDEG